MAGTGDRPDPGSDDRSGHRGRGTGRWIVTVRSSYTSRIDEVTGELQAAGLVVERVLRTVGQVTGRLAEDRVAVVRGMAAVESVDADITARIPPPESDVQ